MFFIVYAIFYIDLKLTLDETENNYFYSHPTVCRKSSFF